MMKRDAFALAMALWISAILMAATLYLISMYKKSVDNAKNLNDKLTVELEADSTIEKLKFYALTGKFENNYIKNSLKGFPDKLYLTDTNQTLDDNITLKLKGAGAMLSLYSSNSMPIDILAKSYSDKKLSFKDVFTDWIDLDSVTLLNGAESGYYNVSSSYSSSNIGTLQHPEELFLIKYFKELTKSSQKNILDNFHFGIYSNINPNIITPTYANRIMELDEFDATQLKSLYKTDLQKYKEYLYLLLQKHNYTEESTSSSLTLYGTIRVKRNKTSVKRTFNIMFRPLYDKPYTVYRNLLYTK